MLDIATLREKEIVSLLALAVPREDELSKWRYRHIRHDVERKILPIHVHVEAAIVKGKYHDHDTFIDAEAAEFLMLYLEQRRRGSLEAKCRRKNSPTNRHSYETRPPPCQDR